MTEKDYDLIAKIIKSLPDSLRQLRIDELIATHFCDQLRQAGEPQFNRGEPNEQRFLQMALPDETWRVINAQGVKLNSSPFSDYQYRRVRHECQKCKSVFISPAHLADHDCKPVIPVVKSAIGKGLVDLNEAE